MLSKFGIQVAREEIERVDTFRYSWQKLLTLAVGQTAGVIKILFNQCTSMAGRSPGHINQGPASIQGDTVN